MMRAVVCDRPGDESVLRLAEMPAAAFIIYMIPVVMTIIGFLVGNALTGGSETSALPIILAVLFLAGAANLFPGVLMGQTSERPRAREMGIAVGVFSPGEHNAITDVAGVAVGPADVRVIPVAKMKIR